MSYWCCMSLASLTRQHLQSSASPRLASTSSRTNFTNASIANPRAITTAIIIKANHKAQNRLQAIDNDPYDFRSVNTRWFQRPGRGRSWWMRLKHLWHVLSMSSTTSVSHIQSYRHYQDQACAQESHICEAPLRHAGWSSRCMVLPGLYKDTNKLLLLLFCIMLGILHQLPQTCRYNTERVWLDPQVRVT